MQRKQPTGCFYASMVRQIESGWFSLYHEAMVHLHTRSCWSLLQSPFRIDEIIQAAQKNHFEYAALTDRKTMYGTMDFLHACKKAGLKPIVGLELDVQSTHGVHNLLFLARNPKGLQQLYALSTRACQSSGLLTLEEAAENTDECFVLTGGEDDRLQECLRSADNQRAESILLDLEAAFPHFRVSAAMNDSPVRQSDNLLLKQICRTLGLKTVALSRIEYEKEKDAERVRMLKAIERQSLFTAPDLSFRTGRYYRSQEEMEALYDPEDLEETENIAAEIDLSSLPEKAELPVFENKAGLSSEEYLRQLCHAGLKKRLHNQIIPEYENRLNYELEIILSMGFADYFLIVWDFIRYSRSQGILVGPGRGSAAGSLVAYCLGISHIDPIAAGLLFERFLNPSRITMPDIDTDFPDDRRDEVIRYLKDRYGQPRTAQIAVFSTMKARMVLRDTARAMGVHIRETEELARLIPAGNDITLKEAYAQSEEFRNRIESTRLNQELFARASSIEGLPRHVSVHSGGIILARDNIVHQAPCFPGEDGMQVVQFTKENLEELGLIKIDLLALRNLTYIQNMLNLIKASGRGKLDLFRLPLNDSMVYQLLSRAQTLGVFQLESDGIRSLLTRFQPRCFEDIAAVIALYRPGPMKEIDTYLNARKNAGRARPLHPLLQDLLQETGGIFLYQEQIMRCAQIMAGFSLAEADRLRKIMSSKNRSAMESWKSRFLEGAAKKNIDQADAEHVFEVMERFADYGYNKAHSYAYALVVYWMAFLKTHFPQEFYTAMLNGSLGGASKTMAFIRELHLRNIPLLPASLNYSMAQYVPQQNGIRIPFGAMKGLPSIAQKSILKERENGSFEDAVEAVVRLARAGLKTDQIETLIWSGAFDEFGHTRSGLAASLDMMIRYSHLSLVDGRKSLIQEDIISRPVISGIPDEPMQLLEKEKDVYGFYLREHPAALVRKRYRDALPIDRLLERNGRNLACAGRITRIKTHTTKKGDEMAFVSLEDETAQIDLAVMPQMWSAMKMELRKNLMVYVQGNKNRDRSMIPNVIVVQS